MATTLEYAILANDCYNAESSGKIGNWVRVDIDSPELLRNDGSGFQAQVYRNMDNNEIVVAYAGTNDNVDRLCEDIPMAFFCVPDQIEDARNLYRYVSENYPDADISVTGHSLGGVLAYTISAETDCVAVTFNNPGAEYLAYSNGTTIGKAKNAVEYLSKYDLFSNVMKHGDNVTWVDLGVFNHFIATWVEYLEKDNNTLTLDAESLKPYLDAYTAIQTAITDIQKVSTQAISLNGTKAIRPYTLAENLASPVTLDLNGDGIITSYVLDNYVNFDLNADRFLAQAA